MNSCLFPYTMFLPKIKPALKEKNLLLAFRKCVLIRFISAAQFNCSATTSYYSYARPAQPGQNWTRLCGPCMAAIAGD